MKKTYLCRTIAIILFAVLVLTPILSLGADYTSMTDENLLDELEQIRAEILKRTINPDKILCQSDGLTISLHKEPFKTEEKYDGTSLFIKCIIVNNGDRAMSVSIDKVAINGWECNVLSMESLDAGKKAIFEVEVRQFTSITDCASADDITDIEFYCYTYDPDSYNTITDNLRKKVVIQ